MNVRKLLLGLVALSFMLGLVLTACSSAAPTPQTSKESPKASASPAGQSAAPAAGAAIKIGLINPSAGPYAPLAGPFNEAAAMAIESINASGGINGSKLELVFQDNQGDPQTTAALVKQLAADKAIVALLGITPIVAAQPASVVAEQEGIVVFAQGPTRSLYEGRKYVFTTAVPEDVSARAEAQFLKEQLKVKKIGIFPDPSEYGQTQTKALQEAATKEGLQTQVETYKFEDVDASPQVLRLKSAGVDSIVLAAAQPKVPAIILKNMESMAWKVPVLGTGGLGSPAFLQLAGPASEGVYLQTDLAYAPAGVQRPLRKGLFDAHAAKKLPGFPLIFHGIAWDAVHLIAEGLKKSGPDRAKLRDAIEQTTGFQGSTGVLNMSPQDHNGRGLEAANFVQVEKGQFKFIWAPSGR